MAEAGDFAIEFLQAAVKLFVSLLQLVDLTKILNLLPPMMPFNPGTAPSNETLYVHRFLHVGPAGRLVIKTQDEIDPQFRRCGERRLGGRGDAAGR